MAWSSTRSVTTNWRNGRTRAATRTVNGTTSRPISRARWRHSRNSRKPPAPLVATTCTTRKPPVAGAAPAPAHAFFPNSRRVSAWPHRALVVRTGERHVKELQSHRRERGALAPACLLRDARGHDVHRGHSAGGLLLLFDLGRRNCPLLFHLPCLDRRGGRGQGARSYPYRRADALRASEGKDAALHIRRHRHVRR